VYVRNKIHLMPVGLALAFGCLLSACSQAPATLDADVPFLQDLTQAAAAGSTADIMDLVHFSTFPCTTADGLGGPPKCLSTEAEGTFVEALPILGPEGYHLRRSDAGSWPGVGSPRLYAVMQSDPGAISDEFYPAGEYGVAFLLEDEANVVVFQVTDRGIVRLDYYPLAVFDQTLSQSNVLLGPVSQP
jgi:hypothetical protein